MKSISKTNLKPELPLVSIYRNKGVEIINEENIKYLKRISAYSLIQDKNDAQLYSAGMKVWSLEQKTDKFKNTKWNRFLAKTIYNPLFDVTLSWEEIKTYPLSELKDKINNCIKKDKGVLTQYVDAHFFIHKIDESNNFVEIVRTLNNYCFDVKNEENVWKENDEWNKNRS